MRGKRGACGRQARSGTDVGAGEGKGNKKRG